MVPGNEDRPGQPGYGPAGDGDGSPEQTHYGRVGGGHQATMAAGGGRWLWWPTVVVVVAALVYLLSRMGTPG